MYRNKGSKTITREKLVQLKEEIINVILVGEVENKVKTLRKS